MPDQDSSLSATLREGQLSALDLGLLWFGAAIAVTEIWAGGLAPLTALGLGLGLLAIVLGRLIGNGLMAAIASAGAATGLSGMQLARPALGLLGSRLLAVFNILQLLGWTGWMLFVGFLYCDILASSAGLPTAAEQPLMRIVWILLLGLLCTLWSAAGARFWRAAQRVTSLLLLLLCLAMSWLLLTRYDLAALFAQPAATPLGLLAGVDVVVVMSVSWVPLVADYSRQARNPHSAGGTFWGYFIGGSWLYALGLLVALAAQTNTPDQMVMQVMAQAGLAWALLAVGLVLFSTITTTFLDIFSAVVSTQSLLPRLPLGPGSAAAGALGTACALWLDVFKYEPFLLAIGLIFLPAFSVIAADYFILRRHSAYRTAAVPLARWPGLLAWLIGALVYDMSRGWSSLGTLLGLGGLPLPAADPWPSGASLPCIAVSVLAYLLLARLAGNPQSANSV